jgi:hypothetical protein
MKRLAIAALIASAALVGCVGAGVQVGGNPAVGGNAMIGGFYDELAPYGRWVDCSYGQCWVPARVAADWQPYSNGQWIYTEYGWTWVSNDPWGGNPYHYGTWASIPNYGWSWVPGTVWAPAWVTWSYDNNYVGWAPLPPTVVLGASGYSGGPVVVSQTQYVFVPTNRFVGGNVSSVRIPAQQSAQIFGQTRPVTSFAVSGGVVRNTALPMQTIERAAGGKIETRSIQGAGTVPRAASPGKARLDVVAPAREVNAAVAARPQAAPGAHPSSRETTRVPAPVERESATAPRAPDAPQVEPHRPPAEAPEARAQVPQRPLEAGRPAEPAPRPTPQPAREQPVAKSNRPPDEPPIAHRPEPTHKAEPGRPAERAGKPTPQPGKEAPEEKDKKPDQEKP